MFPIQSSWFTREPLTEDQMKSEIAGSQIKLPPNKEFSKEAIHKTLKELNILRDDHARPGNESESTS